MPKSVLEERAKINRLMWVRGYDTEPCHHPMVPIKDLHLEGRTIYQCSAGCVMWVSA